jgi:Skp family chaperone for outer membrane proteins
VKQSHRWAILAAAVLSFGYLISLAVAQQGPVRPGAGPHVALLDVSYIFKNHARFKDMMQGMKADVERAEAHVKSERDAIGKLAEGLGNFRKGTPDYKQMEEELAKRQADLSVQVTLQKNEFLQREATIYHNVYEEILQATDYYSKQNGIDMVVRFNGDPVDVQRPDSVLAHINQQVVWYQKNMDITPAILQELNRTAVNPGPARAAPARPAGPFNGVR